MKRGSASQCRRALCAAVKIKLKNSSTSQPVLCTSAEGFHSMQHQEQQLLM